MLRFQTLRDRQVALDAVLRVARPHTLRPRSTGHRLRSLLRALDLFAPELVRPEHLPMLTELAARPWIRPLDRFRGGSRRDLLRHLLVRVRFDLPEWLWATLEQPRPWGRELGLAMSVLAHVGDGGDLRHRRAGELPAPLTRRMRALLWSSTQPTLGAALRHAQVEALGGPTRLAEVLGQQPGLDRVQADGVEARVVALLRWLCPRIDPDLPDALLAEIWAWAWRQPATPRVALTTAIRELARIRAERAAGRRSNRIGPLPPSSLPPLSAVIEGTAWSVTQVRSGSELFWEGKELAHCVAMYEPRARSGHCAIFSLRREGLRTLTLEVTGKGVIQARGFRNRLPTPEEEAVIATWAQTAAIEICRFTG